MDDKEKKTSHTVRSASPHCKIIPFTLFAVNQERGPIIPFFIFFLYMLLQQQTLILKNTVKGQKLKAHVK